MTDPVSTPVSESTATVAIVSDAFAAGFIRINASEFDARTHRVYDDSPLAPPHGVAAHAAHPTPVESSGVVVVAARVTEAPAPRLDVLTTAALQALAKAHGVVVSSPKKRDLVAALTAAGVTG